MSGAVEIAGGGIAGLTTGLAFARKGWRVRVHEQDEDLRILGAGIYIWENGLRVLAALGVLDAVLADTLPPGATKSATSKARFLPTAASLPIFAFTCRRARAFWWRFTRR